MNIKLDSSFWLLSHFMPKTGALKTRQPVNIFDSMFMREKHPNTFTTLGLKPYGKEAVFGYLSGLCQHYFSGKNDSIF